MDTFIKHSFIKSQVRILPSYRSGQIVIFHQPRFPWNKGISALQLPFGGPKNVWGRELIWPDRFQISLDICLTFLHKVVKETRDFGSPTHISVGKWLLPGIP